MEHPFDLLLLLLDFVCIFEAKLFQSVDLLSLSLHQVWLLLIDGLSIFKVRLGLSVRGPFDGCYSRLLWFVSQTKLF